jgi:hypothetical protein
MGVYDATNVYNHTATFRILRRVQSSQENTYACLHGLLLHLQPMLWTRDADIPGPVISR